MSYFTISGERIELSRGKIKNFYLRVYPDGRACARVPMRATNAQIEAVIEPFRARFAELEDALTVVDEALWLTDKFGFGEYADVPGLCKIATLREIEEKNWSLTPGAHVGVPPQEDDGVDFHERMGEIHEELKRLQAESNELMATISRNFKELGL